MDVFQISKWLKRLVFLAFALASLLFLARESLLMYGFLTAEPAKAEKPELPPQIPEAAMNTGEEFLGHWFYVGEKENAFDKLERMKPFMTETLYTRVQQENMIPRENKEVHRIRTWEPEWEVEGKRALISYRVTFKDGKIVYYRLPLVKAGTWMVDGIPGIIPEQQREKWRRDASKPDLSDEQLTQLQRDLDSFFAAWLAGKDITRYAKGDLEKENILEKMNADYNEVVLFPANDSPIQFEALVNLKDSDGKPFYSQYLVTVEEKNGEWFVVEIR